MLTVLFVALLAGVTVLLPAFYLQFALSYWFRPAERLSLEEAWARRFEDVLTLSSPVHQSDGGFRD
jgi:hypothetical protein